VQREQKEIEDRRKRDREVGGPVRDDHRFSQLYRPRLRLPRRPVETATGSYNKERRR
jgi:hypothetical protein